MNILFLANNILSPISGGIERTTFNLIRELSKDLTFKIFVVFMKIPEEIPGTVCVEDIIKNGKQIDDYIKRFSVDIVLFPCGDWYTNLLKSYNPEPNCKIITCLHSPPKVGEDYILENLNLEWSKKNYSSKLRAVPNYVLTYLKHPFKVYQVRSNYNRGYFNSDAYVLLSESFFNDFRKYARIIDISKLFAIGNALSFNETFKVEHLLQKKKEILVVSRFDEISKRISYAIKTWQLVNQRGWKFKIIGFGKDEILYQSMVSKNRIKNISFEGKQNPLNYYRDAKIFLMTSAFEGWGMTITEALQMGCVPIVMDSFASLHDIIVDKYNGLIIRNGDVVAMANAVQSLIDNENEWLRLSKNAIESSSKFTVEKTAIKWKQLFYSVTSN